MICPPTYGKMRRPAPQGAFGSRIQEPEHVKANLRPWPIRRRFSWRKILRPFSALRAGAPMNARGRLRRMADQAHSRQCCGSRTVPWPSKYSNIDLKNDRHT